MVKLKSIRYSRHSRPPNSHWSAPNLFYGLASGAGEITWKPAENTCAVVVIFVVADVFGVDEEAAI